MTQFRTVSSRYNSENLLFPPGETLIPFLGPSSGFENRESARQLERRTPLC